MIVWALIVTLEWGPAIPLEIFPDNNAGYESCVALVDETKLMGTFRQAKELRCQRYQMKPVESEYGTKFEPQ